VKAAGSCERRGERSLIARRDRARHRRHDSVVEYTGQHGLLARLPDKVSQSLRCPPQRRPVDLLHVRVQSPSEQAGSGGGRVRRGRWGCAPESPRPSGKRSEPAVDLSAGSNRLARRRPPNGRDGRPAPLVAGGESAARSRIACHGRYGVSRPFELHRCGDEGQGLGHLAEVKHMLDCPGARTYH
jgi:hypothetical protein